MNAREWLATREPRPPAALTARIDAVLGDVNMGAQIPEVLVEAAGVALEALLSRPQRERAVALDLLAADALATYAFEAASEDPATIEQRATEAMRRLSVVRVGS
ncbi:MAG: hypothetical protein MNPFHGCM_02855 [Gemmatimonadaceae bacterium]|nr:hypothetical protein [Gemmatimonadaceae bacterium]